MLIIGQGISALVIAVRRPRVAPSGMLVFFVSLSVVEGLIWAASSDDTGMKSIARQLSIYAALMSAIVILGMPLRDPSLPETGISCVGQKPSDEFRSPEDNIRLWQFLTVSWLSPLISIGRKRTINESDVWLLAFEFQHKRLHEKFRRLKGSLIRRLLDANGIDVCIVAFLAILQMTCDFASPILLQQLLKAMEDPSLRDTAMAYAAMMLFVRLVYSQLQVLNLWYGRRCYERSRGEMIMMVYEKALSRKNIFGQKVHASNQQKDSASMGKIFNLLRGDVYEVAQRFWEIDSLVDKPLGLIIAVALVWKLFGPSCLLGVLTVLAAQVVNALITKMLLHWERRRRAATDARLQISSQFIEALRHLRWYGWQDHWLKQVMDSRHRELKLRVATSLWNISLRFVNAFASGVFPVVALYAYTILAGRSLSIDIIFPALQLFTMLETRLRELPTLITTLINASIAMSRIEDFMAEPDKGAIVCDSTNSTSIQLEACSFAWPGQLSPVLKDVNISISPGLTVVFGEVGAGKTALLQALLGELDKLNGIAHLPNEMVGYCAQTPWLQSMSIRDNILFSFPYDEQRYKRVLDACCLVPDLANFKHGDLSFIGENGIGLSGGQKARVALARALYSPARILFLDDPLSALDHNTAEQVVRKCFTGPLMHGRTVVLVTHRTSLVRSIADQLIEVIDGHVQIHDKEAPTTNAHPSDDETPTESESEMDPDDVSAVVPPKFIEEEHRAEWGVQARVYWAYIRAGKLKWWGALIAVLAVYRTTAVGQAWFLKELGEAYKSFVVIFQHGHDVLYRFSADWPTQTPFSTYDAIKVIKNPLRDLPAPTDDVRPWLWIFFGLATFQALTLLVAQILMLVIIYCAGKTLFREIMERVSHATFRFFDVTPLGRLMNRLTSDIGVVDGNISDQFQLIAFQAITWVSSILVIASVTPTFLVFTAILTSSFIYVFSRFLPLSQSLRRLEMVSLSPLLSNFGELLHGLTTVRAFRAETRFQDRVIAVVDKFQGMDHFYWSLQSWLMYRFEVLSGLSTFCLTALAVYTDLSPGLSAFVLIAANNFVTSTHALCKQYGRLQMNFVSVERVDELRHIETEPAGAVTPPASWPRFGSEVVFEDVTIRYAPHLDPSLQDVNLKIPGGTTTAIIGRTGSGKSTLALSLLGVIVPERGRILIDGIDIATVNRQALRTRVTFVAQDPILFPGTIRRNLDPVNEYTDEECAEILQRLCHRHGWTLDTHVEAGGRNLSQGQRQLLGLARAVLRRSPIVILDEATASIDQETAMEIQRIIREELQYSTVLTIAHRLEAIREAGYYVVLERGKVARTGAISPSS